ncbi:MAG: glycosyltransferase 87 family protein [Chthoniobacterales bacterium]
MNFAGARTGFVAWSERLNSPTAFRLTLWFFAAVLLVFAAIPVANALLGESIKDYELWYKTGQRILHGEQIYPKRNSRFPFMYPPTAALLLAPISLLGKTGLVVPLVLVNAGAWVASILLSVRLAAGNWKRQHLLVYVIPSALIAVYAWSNFHLGQPSLVLLALLLGAFVALDGKRNLLAGALIALAAAIKAFPFVTIVYLLYRRYWTAAASLVAALIFLLLLLPAPIRGWQQAQTDVQRWTRGMLLKYDERGLAQRPGRSNSWKNQSIFGIANRMLRHVDADDRFAAHTPLYANFADLSFSAVNRIILGSGVVLGLVFVAVLPRRARRTSEIDAMEFALLVLLMLLFTPLAFGYLFACLLFPFTVIVERLLQRPSRTLLAGGVVAIVLLALTLVSQRTAQTYGNTFLATLTLFLALARELWSAKQLPLATIEKGAQRGPEPSN